MPGGPRAGSRPRRALPHLPHQLRTSAQERALAPQPYSPRRLSRNTAIPFLSLTGSAATRKAPSTWSRNSGHRTVRSTYRPPHPDTITNRVKGPRHSAHGAGPQGHATRTHAPPPHGTPVALGHTRNAHLRIVLWRLGRAVDHPAAHGPAHLRAHTYRHTCTHTRTARAHGSSVNSTASSWCPRVREGWCGRVASCTVRGAPGPHTRIFSSSCCAPPTSSCSGTRSIAARSKGRPTNPKKNVFIIFFSDLVSTRQCRSSGDARGGKAGGARRGARRGAPQP